MHGLINWHILYLPVNIICPFMRNRYFLLLLLVAVGSCSAPSTNPVDVAAGTTESADIPAGAQREPFPDNPALEKITLRDGSGAIIQSGTVLSGKRTGVWTEFQNNGAIKSMTGYIDGKKEGWYVEVNNNGQVTRKIEYHNNMRHGEYKEFEYMSTKEERFYQNDKLEGLVKIYYPGGKIMEEGTYKNGTRHGLSKWYDQQGNVTIEYEYNEGQLVKK